MTEPREDIALNDLIAEHWLMEVHCEHAGATDQALCYCGWRGEEYKSVGEAVKSWAGHVAALLRPHVWEWIPVEERLPEKPGWYLACHKTIADGTPVRRSWFDGEWFKMNQITHWTSLPSAPSSLESSDQK